MLTLQQLIDLPPYTIFARGETTNSPDGIYMTDSDFGRKLRWITKRGEIYDWAIYIHWADSDWDYIRDYGDKVFDKDNIRKLVPCDDEALAMYRY